MAGAAGPPDMTHAAAAFGAARHFDTVAQLLAALPEPPAADAPSVGE